MPNYQLEFLELDLVSVSAPQRRELSAITVCDHQALLSSASASLGHHDSPGPGVIVGDEETFSVAFAWVYIGFRA